MGSFTFFNKMKIGLDADSSKAEPEKVGRARRVGHSLRDYILTMGPKSKDAQGKVIPSVVGDKSHLTRTGQAVDIGMNAVSLGGVAMGGLVIAGVTGVVLTALTGGIAAVVIGVVGLAVVFVKSAYSNRDGAHEALQKHVWTLVDDDAPTVMTVEQLYQASAAGMTLLEDGKNQIARLGPKLQKAADRLASMHGVLKKNEELIQSETNFAKVENYRKQSNTIIRDNMKKGGAIFEFTRRAVHTGNYMQAPTLIAMAMQHKFSPGPVPLLPDCFNQGLGLQCRALFQEMGDFYTSVLHATEIRDAAGAAARQTTAATAIGKATPTVMNVNKPNTGLGMFKR